MIGIYLFLDYRLCSFLFVNHQIDAFLSLFNNSLVLILYCCSMEVIVKRLEEVFQEKRVDMFIEGDRAEQQ